MRDEIQRKNRILEKGLDLLANRAHSEYELKVKLLKKFDQDKETVSQVIKDLKEKGFLNDTSFSINFIKFHINRGGHGRSYIYSKLMRKGLSRDLVNGQLAALLTTDKEYSIAYKVIESESRFNKGPEFSVQLTKLSDAEKLLFRIKIKRYLKNRGFSHEIISRIIFRDGDR